MAVKDVTELFALDGRDFVTETYLNLLKREPDKHGLMYYLGRLAQGHSKAAVIDQLARSSECRPHDEIKGLKKLIIDEQHARSWFWRWFGRRGLRQVNVCAGSLQLAQFDAQLARTNQHLASLQDALKTAANNHTRQMEHLVRQVAQLQIISPEQDQLRDNLRQLTNETVEQVFIEVLGRMPESVEVISHHAKSESRQVLRKNLMASTEFQSRLAVLSEHASSIFQRQIKIVKARYGE